MPNEEIKHVMLIPAPLHRPETACGIVLLEGQTPEGNHLLVSNPDDANCENCRAQTGRGLPDWTDGVPTIEGLDIEGNKINVSMGAGISAHMAQALKGLLDEKEAVNYVEMVFLTPPDDAEIVVIVQRKEGKSPHQLREEAEAEIQRLKSWDQKAADLMAAIIDEMISRGELDARSLLADARLDYGEPFPDAVRENIIAPWHL